MAAEDTTNRMPVLEGVSAVSRGRLWLLTAGAVGVIALIDARLEPNLSLGLLYLFPILLAAIFLNRWQLLGVAVFCVGLRERLSPFPLDGDAAARSAMALVAFLGTGLFVGELYRNRQRAVEHGRQLEEQIRLRREAEEELRVLVESSPAAIVTIDAEGKVLLANGAAQRLLVAESEVLQGQWIGRYLPTLASVLGAEPRLSSLYRTTLECIGRTGRGERFLAHVWFSTYETLSGPRLAAIILDASEQLRDREALGLHSVATASRVLFGAVSHEVRNLSAAAGVAYANLARSRDLAANEDFKALGTLLEGLEKIASAELRLAAESTRARADLDTVLDELRVLLEPVLDETDTTLDWQVPEDLPAVCGEHHGLLQVFLNLGQNSHRELQRVQDRRLTVSAVVEKDGVLVRFQDSGPGVQHPEKLFRPFQHGSDATGLGLYVSRAIVRSFAGDLRYEPRPRGGCFVVEVAKAS
jgi:two-component system, LuxR family, sensor kinase FixL